MIHITMMRDMPGQTKEDTKKDLKIIHNMGYSTHNMQRSYQLSICAPFPGTKLYEQVKEKIEENELKKYKKYDGGQETIMVEIQ